MIANSEPTEEQTAKMKERRASGQSETEFAKSVRDAADTIFGECSPNEHGRLTETAFVEFYKKQKVATDGLGGFLPGYTDE